MGHEIRLSSVGVGFFVGLTKKKGQIKRSKKARIKEH